MGLHTSGHTRKKSSFSTQDEHLVLLGLEALTDGPQPPLRDTLYLDILQECPNISPADIFVEGS